MPCVQLYRAFLYLINSSDRACALPYRTPDIGQITWSSIFIAWLCFKIIPQSNTQTMRIHIIDMHPSINIKFPDSPHTVRRPRRGNCLRAEYIGRSLKYNWERANTVRNLLITMEEPDIISRANNQLQEELKFMKNKQIHNPRRTELSQMLNIWHATALSLIPWSQYSYQSHMIPTYQQAETNHKIISRITWCFA